MILCLFRVHGFRLGTMVLLRYMRTAVILVTPMRPVACPRFANPRIQHQNQHNANYRSDNYDSFHRILT
jgi:hypothetical protein